MQLSKQEQVSALVSGQKSGLVCKVLNKKTLNPEDYNKVINISKTELFKYLKNNYSIDELIYLLPSKKDGFYAIKNNNNWLTYGQEREIHFDKKEVNSIDDVWEQYIKVELGYA